jgi:hypothetical protein
LILKKINLLKDVFYVKNKKKMMHEFKPPFSNFNQKNLKECQNSRMSKIKEIRKNLKKKSMKRKEKEEKIRKKSLKREIESEEEKKREQIRKIESEEDALKLESLKDLYFETTSEDSSDSNDLNGRIFFFSPHSNSIKTIKFWLIITTKRGLFLPNGL